MTDAIDEQVLRSAMEVILPKLDRETVTLAVLRQKLSAYLQIDPDQLREWKFTIKALVTELMDAESDQSGDDDKENSAPPVKAARVSKQQPQPAARKKRNVVSDASDEESEHDNAAASEGPSAGESDAHDESEEEEPAPKKKRARVAEPSQKKSPAERKKKNDSTPKAAKVMDPKGLAALKEMARAAGLLGPHIYKKLKETSSADEAEDLVRELLQDASVRFSSRYPSKQEIAAVKRKKDMEKDLEGIDTSMIITGGRPRRAAAQVAPVYFDESPKKSKKKAKKDEEEYDDGQGDEHDGEEEGEGESAEDEQEEEDDDASDSSEASFKLDDDDSE